LGIYGLRVVDLSSGQGVVRMDLATLAGIVVGCAVIIGAMMTKGATGAFFHIPSLAIVVGGTVAATLINCSFADLVKIPRLLRVVLSRPTTDKREMIGFFVALAEKARREGLLAIEDEAREVADPFLKQGVQLVVDGTDPELVRSILEIELTFLGERHARGRNVFEVMGIYSPAFGMIGTLLGLVQMLAKLDDPDKVAPGIALALLTTLYGSVMANLIFIPISKKLKLRTEAEIEVKEIILEGVLSIQAGENPRLVEEKLQAFLSPEERRGSGGDEAELKAQRAVKEGAVAGDTT